MADAYTPTREDKFSFGLWTVGNPGRDPFGDPTRQTLAPERIVQRLSELGAWGINLHDNDLVPIDATPQQRDKIVCDFKTALKNYGMVVPMATTNTFSHPVFKDGGFTSNDPKIRAYGLQKIMQAIDLGVELGAKTYVFWGGREGAECNVAKDPIDALKRYRDGLNYLCDYVRDQKYDLNFALEAKPNEPRADMYFPHNRALSRIYRNPGLPRNGGRQPGSRTRTHGGVKFPPRRGASTRIGQTLPHRLKRPAFWPL